MMRRPRASTAGGQRWQEAPPRVFGALSVDLAGREVHRDNREVALTRTEFDVLAALGSTRAGLLPPPAHRCLWDQSWVGQEHLVDVHVGHLRRKLGDDPGSPR
jgi:DNA-binding response OmpR family regulator